jgi:hypothetical protein
MDSSWLNRIGEDRSICECQSSFVRRDWNEEKESNLNPIRLGMPMHITSVTPCTSELDLFSCPNLKMIKYWVLSIEYRVSSIEYRVFLQKVLPQNTAYVRDMIEDIHDKRPKRKSLTMGELENSGFRRTQLETTKVNGIIIRLSLALKRKRWNGRTWENILDRFVGIRGIWDGIWLDAR